MAVVLYNNKTQCTGCGACKSVCPSHCISMEADLEGFKYPVIDTDNCTGCHNCIHSCPINHCSDSKISETSQYFTAQHKDDEIIIMSSSGGVFSALANDFLKTRGIVYGCVFNKDMQAVHEGVENESGLKFMRGSKYVQSDIQDSYNQIKIQLNEGRKILFTGTPCQVAGLKTFLGKNYQNLLLVDLLCHGVPSPKLFSDYISYLEKKHGGKVVKYEFRNKKIIAWGSGHRSYYEIEKNGKVKGYRSTLPAYYCAFFYGLNLRPSCYECRYSTPNRNSDITIGDFWGFWKTYKRFFPKGISILSINSEKGRDSLDLLSQAMALEPVSFEQAISGNPSFIKPFVKPSIREDFYKLLEGKKYNEINKILFFDWRNWKTSIRTIYGKFVPVRLRRQIRKIIAVFGR